MIITYLQKKLLNITQLHEQFIPKIGAEGYLNLNYYESHRICQMKCWINSESFQRQNPIYFNSFLQWDFFNVNFHFLIFLFRIDFPGNGIFEKRPSIGLEALISILDDEEVWTRLFRPRNMSRYHGLSSFKVRDTKSARFLGQNQLSVRKLLYFVNRH